MLICIVHPPVFILQVTTLVNQKSPSSKKKGRSKKAHVLSAAVQKATENFIARGEEIANENPDIRADMMAAVDEVRKTGKSQNMSPVAGMREIS